MRDKVIAGIDIGGTNTVFGFVAEDGEILAKSRIDTICHGTFDEYVAALCEAVDALKRLASRLISAYRWPWPTMPMRPLWERWSMALQRGLTTS